MDQTFLLGTIDSIVGRIKIRYQNAREILEQSLDRVAFAGRGIEIGHLLQAGEDPYVATDAPDADAGLVDMQQATAAQPFQEIVIGASIGFRRRGLHPIRPAAREM